MRSKLQIQLARREDQDQFLDHLLSISRTRADEFDETWAGTPFANARRRSRKVLDVRCWGPMHRLLRVSRHWVRTPRDWSPGGASPESVSRSLVRHLVCRYPMPHWWFDVWTVPNPALEHGDPQWRARDPFVMHEARMFVAVAGGVGFRGLVETGELPVPLTRKECHALRHQQGVRGLVHAVRKTQVLARGGSRALARAVLDTDWGDAFAPAGGERRRARVLTWMCAQPNLRTDQVYWITDYFQAREPTPRLRGRSLESVMRQVAEYHDELGGIPIRARERPAGADVRGHWGRSGLEGYADEDVAVVELLDYRGLVREGRVLQHCVATYASKAAAGLCSLWSFRLGGVPRLTIEVRSRGRVVVQIRGRHNRPPTRDEMVGVRRWAAANGLRVEEG